MRVIVTGGKKDITYKEVEQRISQALFQLGTEGLLDNVQQVEFVSSQRKGAESLGLLFATNNSMPIKIFEVKGDVEDSYSRCERMVNYAVSSDRGGVLLYFPGSTSHISQQLIDLAQQHNMRILEV